MLFMLALGFLLLGPYFDLLVWEYVKISTNSQIELSEYGTTVIPLTIIYFIMFIAYYIIPSDFKKEIKVIESDSFIKTAYKNFKNKTCIKINFK